MPCCGLEMQNVTQTVKGLGNTFDLNPKWPIILPLGILHEIYISLSPELI
jgi:hypothetical protein